MTTMTTPHSTTFQLPDVDKMLEDLLRDMDVWEAERLFPERHADYKRLLTEWADDPTLTPLAPTVAIDLGEYSTGEPNKRVLFFLHSMLVGAELRELGERPIPPLSPRTERALNKLAQQTNESIAEARKHGAPHHWSGESTVNTLRECQTLLSRP